jgi:hypothetical protein
MNIYQEHGYDSRLDYLETLAEQNDTELQNVLALAHLLGPEEDFDGLVTMIEDHVNGY